MTNPRMLTGGRLLAALAGVVLTLGACTPVPSAEPGGSPAPTARKLDPQTRQVPRTVGLDRVEFDDRGRPHTRGIAER